MQTGAREPLSANFDMPRLRLIDYDIIITLALCVWCHRQTPYVLCAYSLRTLRTPQKFLNNILYLWRVYIYFSVKMGTLLLYVPQVNYALRFRFGTWTLHPRAVNKTCSPVRRKYKTWPDEHKTLNSRFLFSFLSILNRNPNFRRRLMRVNLGI